MAFDAVAFAPDHQTDVDIAPPGAYTAIDISDGSVFDEPDFYIPADPAAQRSRHLTRRMEV
ncbi:hypothetical protein ABZS81_00910 [Streptomyces sp. NPDC005318]|uniref:hypothetical protein n=1 Tax=Streptomyces sp. NPDC005318 TaxID=3157031 RepID=UPI0033A1EC9C